MLPLLLMLLLHGECAVPPMRFAHRVPRGGGAAKSTHAIDLGAARYHMPPERYVCRRTTTTPPYEQCTYAPDQDIHVSGSIQQRGHWELDVLNDLKSALQFITSESLELSTVVFVDVGANLGVFSLFVAALGVRRIVAFEPLPTNAGIFVASVLRNPGFNESIRIIAAGAAESAQRLPMFLDLKNRGGTSFSRIKISELEEVPAKQRGTAADCAVVPLDSVVAERVHIMKIDVEGFESCVVAGAQQLFRNHGVAIVYIEFWSELSPCAESTQEFIDDLLGMGYAFYDSFQQYRTKPRSAKTAAQIARLLNSRSFNQVLIRTDLLQ
jgi:FkbM family methyltransferase